VRRHYRSLPEMVDRHQHPTLRSGAPRRCAEAVGARMVSRQLLRCPAEQERSNMTPDTLVAVPKQEAAPRPDDFCFLVGPACWLARSQLTMCLLRCAGSASVRRAALSLIWRSGALTSACSSNIEFPQLRQPPRSRGRLPLRPGSLATSWQARSARVWRIAGHSTKWSRDPLLAWRAPSRYVVSAEASIGCGAGL
jgi:hypothetical protein